MYWVLRLRTGTTKPRWCLLTSNLVTLRFIVIYFVILLHSILLSFSKNSMVQVIFFQNLSILKKLFISLQISECFVEMYLWKAHERCLGRSEECMKNPITRVIGDCEPPWVLDTELWSLLRSTDILNRLVISPASYLFINIAIYFIHSFINSFIYSQVFEFLTSGIQNTMCETLFPLQLCVLESNSGLTLYCKLLYSLRHFSGSFFVYISLFLS